MEPAISVWVVGLAGVTSFKDHLHMLGGSNPADFSYTFYYTLKPRWLYFEGRLAAENRRRQN
jgi:hypothetical protein